MAGKDGHAVSKIPDKPPMISPLEEAASVGGLCSSHPGEPLIIYCRTCLTLICVECMDDAHGDHLTKSVKKHLPVLKGEIAQSLSTVEARVTEQKVKLEQLIATIEREEKEFATELDDREEQQRVAVTQLEGQYRKLQEELEKDFKQKKEALEEHMTLGYKRQMTSQMDELTAARDQLLTECEDLDNIIADCRSRIDAVDETSKEDPPLADQGAVADDREGSCSQLSVSDVVAVLPQLKSLNESDPTLLPDEHPPVAPLSVPEQMKSFYARIIKDAAGFLSHVQELLDKPAGTRTVLISPEFLQGCKNYAQGQSTRGPQCAPLTATADPAKGYRVKHLKLTTVSEEAGKELAQLFGGGDVLIKEIRHRDEVLRTTTGTVTHVWANVNGGFYWLPADVSVVESLRLASFTYNKAIDRKSQQDVTNTNTLDWFDSSPDRYLSVYQ